MSGLDRTSNSTGVPLGTSSKHTISKQASSFTRSRATRHRRLAAMALLACTGLAGAVLPASAQVVQRSFVDQGFEVPYIGTTVRPATGCSRTLPANWVPGWEPRVWLRLPRDLM